MWRTLPCFPFSRRRIRQHTGNSAGRCVAALRLLRGFATDGAILVVAFARGGDLVHVQLYLNLGGKGIAAEHRCKQVIHLRIKLCFHLRLQIEPAAVRIASLSQQFAVLIHDLYRIDPEAGHGCSHEIRDSRDLSIGKLATARQTDHHRCGRCDIFAHEHRTFGLGDMDADRFDAVDFCDGHGQFAFLRRAQTIAFQRTAGPHREAFDKVGTALWRCERSIGRHQHPRAIDVVFADRQRTGAIVDRIIDPGLVERLYHAGAFGIGKGGIQDTLRGGRQHRPRQCQQTQTGHSAEPGQRPLDGRLRGEGAKAVAKRATPGCERSQHAGALALGRYQTVHGLDSHPHGFLVRGKQLVADLESCFEGDPGFLPGQHHLGDIGFLAAFICGGHAAGFCLDRIDVIQRCAE